MSYEMAPDTIILCTLRVYTANYMRAKILHTAKDITIMCGMPCVECSFAKETYNLKEPTNRSHPIVFIVHCKDVWNATT